jgi:hypothetical protein
MLFHQRWRAMAPAQSMLGSSGRRLLSPLNPPLSLTRARAERCTTKLTPAAVLLQQQQQQWQHQQLHTKKRQLPQGAIL